MRMICQTATPRLCNLPARDGCACDSAACEGGIASDSGNDSSGLQKHVEGDVELAELVDCWDPLSPAIRAGILAMVRASSSAGR